MARKKFFEKATYVALYAVTIIGMMVNVIIINPVVVWVLALIAPKRVARMSYKDVESLWELVVNLPFWANRWMWRVLPWRSRKCYIDEGFDDLEEKLSSQDRLKFFVSCYTYECSWKPSYVYTKLRPAEKNKVFEKYRDFVIGAGEVLTDEQFAQLDYVQIRKYAQKHNGLNLKQFELLASAGKNKGAAETLSWVVYSYTPSFEQIEVLAENSLDDLLIGVIATYGLAKGKVTELKTHISDTDSERWKKIERALRCNSQIKIVKSGKLDDWRHICETEDICIGTQYYMTDDHYDVFHSTGHQLHDRAVVSLLQSRNLGFAEKIFEFEPNNGLNSEDAKAIVESDPQLKLSLYKVRAKSKEANK